jgi:hypothetical protein
VKRRSFFKRLAQAAGLIALAPQLAFKAPSFELPAGYGIANCKVCFLSPVELRRLFFPASNPVITFDENPPPHP